MSQSSFDQNKKYGLSTAIALVVANMVGVGVFTSLGFQVMGLTSGLSIVLLWILGGVVALLGAFSYAELGKRMPRSGGEYHYLTQNYHPSVGFLSGWTSLTMGFAAPVAASSMACGTYLVHYLAKSGYEISEKLFSSLVAIGVIVLLTIIHTVSKKKGAQLQNVLTLAKVLFILVFIFGGFALVSGTQNSFEWNFKVQGELLSPAFAVSFFFVSYAYSGWNASSYIASEIHNPKKNLPLSLLIGTAFVTCLYVLLNTAFMKVIPVSALKDASGAPVIDVGAVFAQLAFGQSMGMIFSLVIAFLLISTVSSMIITGPRVAQILGEDHTWFKWLSFKNDLDIPWLALIVQALLSIAYILTSSFEGLIVMIGFILNLFTFLSVLGLFWTKRPSGMEAPSVWIFPIIPALFLLINAWMLYFGFCAKPHESLMGLGIAFVGFVVWWLEHLTSSKKKA